MELQKEDISNTERELKEEPRWAGETETCRPRNWLVPVILVTLREWNSYGYELMERAAAFGFEAMNPGTLLQDLETHGDKTMSSAADIEREPRVSLRWQTLKKVAAPEG